MALKAHDIPWKRGLEYCPEALAIQAQIDEKKGLQSQGNEEVARLEERAAHISEAKRMVSDAITAGEARLRDVAFAFVVEQVPLEDAQSVKAEIEALRLQLELYELAIPRLEMELEIPRKRVRSLGSDVLELEERRNALVEQTRERLARATI